MARKTTAAQPLKLPKAPQQYSERDQDHTRRLIELAFGQYGLQLQQASGGDAAVGGGTGILTIPTGQHCMIYAPVSPLIATVHTVGNTGTPPFVQLKNLGSTAHYAVIYGLRVRQTGGSGRVLARITDTPLTLGGSITVAQIEHLDENDASTIYCTLKGCDTLTDTPFTEVQAQFNERLDDSSVLLPTPVVPIGSFPLVLPPGWALEVETNANGSAQDLMVTAIWDELTAAQFKDT